MTDSTSESSPSPPPRCGRRSDEESSTAGSFRRLLHANSAANAMAKGDGRSSMTEPGDTGARDDRRDRDSILDPGARDETRRRSVGFRVDDVDT